MYKAYTDADGGIHKEYQLLYDAESSDAEVVKAQAVKAMLRYVEDMGLSEYATLHDTTAGEVTLSFYFPSATDYQIACGYTGREKNEAENSKLDGIYKVSETTLDSYLEEETLSKARDYVDEEYRDFSLEGNFFYVYGTPYRSIRSNGEVTQKDGIYYHVWRLYPDSKTNMVLRSYSLNGILLYAGIILAFVLSLVVIFVIIYINKSKVRNGGKRLSAEDPQANGEISDRCEE